MRLYFYNAETTEKTLADLGAAIHGILERTGATVVTKQQSAQEAFPESYDAIERRGRSFLELIDAIIIEGSTTDPEIGYLLAFAIAQKKPALLLLRKHTSVKNPLTTFGQKVPRNIRVVFYDASNVEKRVLAFLATIGSFEYEELPTIKFTLRITPQIEEYLDWKTHNTKLTKADFLRKIILDDVIAQDATFQAKRKRKSP
jgi:hypothetical protein